MMKTFWSFLATNAAKLAVWAAEHPDTVRQVVEAAAKAKAPR